MASVTYKNQPAIDASNRSIPLAGTSHLYTVKKVLWPESIEDFLKTLFIGKTLYEYYVWQPRTYFGRAQIISVFNSK